MTNQTTPNVYSKYDHGFKSDNLFMDFYFQKENKHTKQIEMKAIVHVSLDDERQSIKFTVDIDSLPEITYDGFEVIAKW